MVLAKLVLTAKSKRNGEGGSQLVMDDWKWTCLQCPHPSFHEAIFDTALCPSEVFYVLELNGGIKPSGPGTAGDSLSGSASLTLVDVSSRSIHLLWLLLQTEKTGDEENICFLKMRTCSADFSGSSQTRN